MDHECAQLAGVPGGNAEAKSYTSCSPEQVIGTLQKRSSCSLERSPEGTHRGDLLSYTPVQVQRNLSAPSGQMLPVLPNDTLENSGQEQGMSLLLVECPCEGPAEEQKMQTEIFSLNETSSQYPEKSREQENDFASYAQNHHLVSIKIDSTETANVKTEEDAWIYSIDGELQISDGDRSTKTPNTSEESNGKKKMYRLSAPQGTDSSAVRTMKHSRWNRDCEIRIDHSQTPRKAASPRPAQGKIAQHQSLQYNQQHKPLKRSHEKKDSSATEKFSEIPQREHVVSNRNTSQVPSQRTATQPTAQEQFYRPRMRGAFQEPDQGLLASREVMPQYPIRFPRGSQSASRPYRFQSLFHESRRSFSVMCTKLETVLHAHERMYCQMKNDLDASFSQVKAEKEAALKEKAAIEDMKRRASDDSFGMHSQIRKLKEVLGGLEDVNTDLSVQLAELNQMQEQLDEQQRVLEVLTKLKPDQKSSHNDEDEFLYKNLQECKAKLSRIETELNQSRKVTERLEHISFERMEYLEEINILGGERSTHGELMETNYAKKQRHSEE